MSREHFFTIGIVGCVAFLAIATLLVHSEFNLTSNFAGSAQASLGMKAHISASPNPCIILPNEKWCGTTISWSTPKMRLPKVQVRVKGENIEERVWACRNTGESHEKTTAGVKIRTDPKTFTIYPAESCKVNAKIGPALGSVEVFGNLETPMPAVPPNIIIILVDDFEESMFPYLETIRTELSDKGTTFTNFFTTDPLCCPSRASILRGQYAHNHQVLEVNNGPISGWQSFRERGHESSTVATWLQQKGYRTMFTGKYLNGYPLPWGTWSRYVPEGWDEWHAGIKGQYYMFNVTFNENGNIVPYGDSPEDYFTDVLSRKAENFIRETEAPFFISVNPTAPHTPSTPAPRHKGTFATVDMPRSPNFDEEDVSDKPQHIRNRARISAELAELMDEEYRLALESMLAVEDMVRKLISTLEETGKIHNTYIFFLSDNGYHQGEHRLTGNAWTGAKRTLYEEDVKIPMIVRGPGVQEGVIVNALVANHDLAPTVAELAGATPSNFVDGSSIVSLFGSSPPWRDAMLLEKWDFGNQNGMPTGAAIRTARYKYILMETGEEELYDLVIDPYELESKHDDSEYDSVKNSLSQRLSNLKECARESCRVAEGFS